MRERERAGRVSDKLEHVGGAGASATSEGGRAVCARAEACQQLSLSQRPTQRAVTRGPCVPVRQPPCGARGSSSLGGICSILHAL